MNWVSEYMKKADEDHEKYMLSQGYVKIPESIQYIFAYHKFLSRQQATDLKELMSRI